MATGVPPTTVSTDAWRGFQGERWRQAVDVRGFLGANVTAYDGNEDFLARPTARTLAVRDLVDRLLEEERHRGFPHVDAGRAAGITAHPPGHLPADLELLVGLQTDEPLRRAVHPALGLRALDAALAPSHTALDLRLREIYTRHRRTVTDAVQDAWTPEMWRALRSGLVRGLAHGVGRGSVLGDYRRVPLYGVDRLIEAKLHDKHFLDALASTEAIVRDREELGGQVRALGELKELAREHGVDIARPAATAREAVQWLYLAYLATVKESNPQIAPLGRVTTFLDAYIERDIAEGTLDESGAQELFDDLVLRLRLVRQLRAPDDRRVPGVDRTVITETVGGTTEDGRLLVTRSSLRILRALRNVGAGGQPTLQVLWSPGIPEAFRRLAVTVALETGDVEFVGDDLVRPRFGDDASAIGGGRMVRTGKHLVLEGGEIDLRKVVFYALNGGRDEVSGEQVAPAVAPLDGPLVSAAELRPALERMIGWVAETHVNAADALHAAHDQQAYEPLATALQDYGVLRTAACRVTGLAPAADLLTAASYGQLRLSCDASGRMTGVEIEGDGARFGYDDPRAQESARWLVERLLGALRRHASYRNAVHTLGVADASPVGACDPLIAARAAAGLAYECCLDGVSLRIRPDDLAIDPAGRAERLTALLDEWGGCHITLSGGDQPSGSVEA